jgi:SNF2-related domain
VDDLYEAGGVQAFEDVRAVRRALYHARFHLTGRLMPRIDLLIVDEAHKLKNPGSLRTRAMRQVFHRRFRRALFLTATPFQLDVVELRAIFRLFGGARGAPKDLLEQVDSLLASVKEYQALYDEFQRMWSSLDPVAAARFGSAYDRDPSEVAKLDEPGFTVILRQIETLKKIKDELLEPGFRQWMIRSLREEKRVYRRQIRKDIRAAGAGALPFLIYERFIAELFRRHRPTHKAAVEINMVSSYAAAHQGTILADGDGIPAEAEPYRDLLRGILSEIESSARDPERFAPWSGSRSSIGIGEPASRM